MFVHVNLDRILTTIAVLLPTFFAIAVELVNRKTKTRPAWRLGVIIFGIMTSAITALQIYKADSVHREETQQRLQETHSLRAELYNSKAAQEVSNAYVRAKLEDEVRFDAQMAQLAPAIKTLAETSASFERKQYQTQLTDDHGIYRSTMKAVTEIRDFAQKREAIDAQEMREMSNVWTARDMSDAEKQRRANQLFDKNSDISRAENREFNSILADVIYATTELLKRKISEPTVDASTQEDVNRALKGILVGVHPELKLAAYLEAWAKPLAMR